MRRVSYLSCLSFSTVAAVVACSSPPDSSGEGSSDTGGATAVTVESIIGGTAATAYSEAAVIDIDRGPTGSYWAFVGGRQPDGTFVFGTETRVDAEQVFKRMVFSGIGPDSFDWRWEFSDDGEQWSERWTIRYQRRVPPVD